MELRSKIGQRGVSLTGLIFVLAILGVMATLSMKVAPTFIEYTAIKKAMTRAKAGTTPAEARSLFNKQAEIDTIKAIDGKDLEITQNGAVLDVSFAYQSTIPLVGPVSLLIDYEGTTGNPLAKKPAK